MLHLPPSQDHILEHKNNLRMRILIQIRIHEQKVQPGPVKLEKETKYEVVNVLFAEAVEMKFMLGGELRQTRMKLLKGELN